MKKCLTAIIIALLFAAIRPVMAQPAGKQEASQINRSVLTAYYIESPKAGTSLYFDHNDRLRKFISWADDPHCPSTYIGYYDVEGQLAYIIFRDIQPEENSFQGVAYVDSSTPDARSVIVEYKQRTGAGAQAVTTDSYVRQSEFPRTIGGEVIDDLFPENSSHGAKRSISEFLSADMLQDMINADKFREYADTRQVLFGDPEYGDACHVNANEVLLREDGSDVSKTLKKLDAGTRVTVIDVPGNGSTCEPGAVCWYKVVCDDIIGYVSADFLEPVEMEMK